MTAVVKKFLLILLSIIPCYALPAQVRFCAVGDVLLDRGIRNLINQHNAIYPFAKLDSLIAGNDIALFNLECPLADKSKGHALDKKYCFRGEPGYIAGLKWAGFNVACLANNHTTDYGKDGLLETVALLKDNKIFPVGAGKTRHEAFQPVLLEKNGETFAFFALLEFLPYATTFKDDQPYPAFGQIDTLCALIREYNSRIDNIIVTFHWGFENTATPNSRQRDYAHKVIMAGADLVLGHHPHVLQSIETYRDKIIAYSLGNFIFDNPDESQKQSLIFRCEFQQGKINNPHFIPMYIKKCRPHPADSLKSRQIYEHLDSISTTYNTELTITPAGLVAITIPAARTVKEIHYQDIKFNFQPKQIEIYDRGSQLLHYNLPDSVYSIKDAGYHIEESVIYFYTIIQNDTSAKSRVAIFPYALFENNFLKPTLDLQDDFNPWKILVGDLDGDLNPELIVGVDKKISYFPEAENRIFVYNRDKDCIYPKWFSSKIHQPIIDFKMEFDSVQRRDKLILLENNADDSLYEVISYSWNRFGFNQDQQWPGLKKDSNIRIDFQLSDLSFTHLQ
jgi:poly-gamma-glutamate synthesis protein (capsule biosynthesis protein)